MTQERLGSPQGVGEPLVSMWLWLTRSPWRPGAAWAVIAGMLASGGMSWRTQDWVRLLFLVLLVDPVWGSVWTLWAEGRPTGKGDSRSSHTRPSLPYLQPGSPAARLWGWREDDRSLMAVWRLGLPCLLIVSLIALVLGWKVVLATALALALCLAGWATRRLSGWPNPWAQALLTIGLPWVLGYWMLRPLDGQAIALAAGLTVWLRAALGIARRERGAWLWLALAQIGVIGLLIALRHPLWAAGVALVCVPTWWMYLRARLTVPIPVILARAQVWWWLALLMSGWALGGPWR